MLYHSLHKVLYDVYFIVLYYSLHKVLYNVYFIVLYQNLHKVHKVLYDVYFIVLYHSLHKVLFMESADQYYNKDNWPLEADRRYVNLPVQVIPSNCYPTIYRDWPKVCQSTYIVKSSH